MNYYKIKKSEYYSGTRTDIISFLGNEKYDNVLEIGAGGGDTLCLIKESGLAKKVFGVELFKLENTNQSNSLIDRFIHSNIEDQNLDLEKESFDLIILADILEHLVDPWEALKYISTFLKKGGKIITSLPNIRDYKSLIKIVLFGDFRYRGDGVLDKTHLRFFCKKNMIDLLSVEDLKIESYRPAFKIRKDRKRRKLIDLITLGFFEQFLTIQYIFEVEKK